MGAAFVLIVVLLNGNGNVTGVSLQSFTSEHSCQAAQLLVAQNTQGQALPLCIKQ